MPDSEKRLYAVYIKGNSEPVETTSPDIRQFDDRLFLVRTEQTRSQLYHAVKQRTNPETLWVAPLEEHPKFKGMAEGTLKWLRSE
ncbi:hypothetical protein GCM10011342_29000 [Aquisalinus flavus]|uniref:Uncharacterized protein n=1 Tax=Aquisalinus flavus TaxID=1526572 RepID=A0A8J2Y5Z7_9PROT|nr:hypothetical protein [Aquisalinus flavus]MBD0428120.1 hypothetical protein [Aquisalinus flavus]GGD18522.1 hypothetical protein GCM10011342_29000 [Aquisalinus flavus]